MIELCVCLCARLFSVNGCACVLFLRVLVFVCEFVVLVASLLGASSIVLWLLINVLKCRWLLC